MAGLKVFLLGPPRIERDGAPIEVGTRKAIALLAYLAVTRQSHSRETLTALLWPEYEQTRSRAALRSTLWALNKALAGEGLDVDREIIGLDSSAGLWLDVDQFHDHLAECHSHGHSFDEVCPACLTTLAAAAALYHDDLLAGFSLRDSPGFDEWRLFQTESLRRELASALERLVIGHSARREFEPALLHARRWVALDPLHEPAHRYLMLAYAWAGQRAAALRQYQECAQVLLRELGTVPQAETTQLNEAIKENRVPSPLVTPLLKPAPPSQPLSGNLATHAPVTPFVGREGELAQIAHHLNDPACRLLTIVGPGGIGKTRLALQAALQAATSVDEAYPHGIYFVPLAPVSSTDFLIPAIAGALAFQFFGRQDPKAQLLNYLGAKTMLMVLDNFEQLLDGMGLLNDILESAPAMKLLVTSRTRLNHPGERCFDLYGLSFPPEAGEGKDADVDANAYSAVQLFLHSARRVHWGFVLGEAERTGVTRICRLLEGLPLGIELAAAWVRVISCAEIAQEIERDLDFLGTTLRGLPERHRSLRAVFDYSWKRLGEEERAVFRRLSVFRGGFTRAAAEQVGGASLPGLTALVDSSFLRRSASGRYEIHELLRQYAEEKIQEMPHKAEETRDRHSRYYAEFLHEQEPRLKGEGQREAIEAMAEDIDNLRAGWRWAVNHGRVEAIQKSLEGLYLFYRIRSRFQEGAQAFARAAEALERGPSPDLLGAILARQGAFAEVLGQFDRARELLDRSVVFLSAQPQEARQDMAFALYELGVVAHRQGKTVEANQRLSESLTLYQSLEDPFGMANALNSLGNVALDLAGQYREARRYYTEGLALRRAIGDRRGMASSLNCLGCAANVLGEYMEGKQLLRESIGLHQEIGDRYGMALALNNLGYNAQLREDHPEARQLYQESLAIRQEVGDRYAIALVLGNLGVTATHLGEYSEAARLLHQSLALHREGGDQGGISYTLSYLGLLACQTEDFPAAKKYFHEALQTALAMQIMPNVMEALVGLATLLTKEGRPEQAIELLALASHQPFTERHVKDTAARALAELESQLPREVLAAAQERGRARKVEEVVAELIEEGKNLEGTTAR